MFRTSCIRIAEFLARTFCRPPLRHRRCRRRRLAALLPPVRVLSLWEDLSSWVLAWALSLRAADAIWPCAELLDLVAADEIALPLQKESWEISAAAAGVSLPAVGAECAVVDASRAAGWVVSIVPALLDSVPLAVHSDFGDIAELAHLLPGLLCPRDRCAYILPQFSSINGAVFMSVF